MLGRLQKVHSKFLESCRTLKDGKDYWSGAGPVKRWFLQLITPVPLLSLQEDGGLLFEALQWLEGHSRTEPLSEELLRKYHRMVTPKKDPSGGEYRKGPISVVGSSIPRAPGERVPALMRQLDFKLAQDQERFDESQPVAESAVLSAAIDTYQRIGLIHPFADANGRVSRLALNHLMRRYGFGYIVLPPLSEKSPLWEALQKAHECEPADLEAFARACLLKV